MVTLPETNMALENGWNISFLLGWPIFRGDLLVSGRVSDHRWFFWFMMVTVFDLIWFFLIYDASKWCANEQILSHQSFCFREKGGYQTLMMLDSEGDTSGTGFSDQFQEWIVASCIAPTCVICSFWPFHRNTANDQLHSKNKALPSQDLTSYLGFQKQKVYLDKVEVRTIIHQDENFVFFGGVGSSILPY